jgi:hypothetical protein
MPETFFANGSHEPSARHATLAQNNSKNKSRPALDIDRNSVLFSRFSIDHGGIMSEETKDDTKNKEVRPVRVFRKGAIAASVWRRRATNGYEYFDFTLSRSWKDYVGKEGYSKSYFASNESQLSQVVSQAAAWIAEQQMHLYSGDPGTDAVAQLAA